jgi:DNA-binding protein H-NS
VFVCNVIEAQEKQAKKTLQNAEIYNTQKSAPKVRAKKKRAPKKPAKKVRNRNDLFFPRYFSTECNTRSTRMSHY